LIAIGLSGVIRALTLLITYSKAWLSAAESRSIL